MSGSGVPALDAPDDRTEARLAMDERFLTHFIMAEDRNVRGLGDLAAESYRRDLERMDERIRRRRAVLAGRRRR